MEDNKPKKCYRAVLHSIDPAGNPYTLVIEENDEKAFYKKVKTAKYVGAF